MIAINQRILDDLLKPQKVTNLIIERKVSVENFLKTPTRIVKRRPVPLILLPIQEQYVEKLIYYFDKIIKADFNSLVDYKKQFDKIIDSKTMLKGGHKEFRNELIKRMGYHELRDNFYPEHFEKIGIKSCVYCNSQLAVTARKVNGVKSAKFQVDHYYPKSEYPCFSISFHNLYPVCGSCNNSKSINPINFRLYSDEYIEFTNSRFLFELDKKSLLKYRINGMQNKLEIRFHDKTGDKSFNVAFAIEGIYETQKDIAEEVVLKSMIYNKTYSDSLRNSLKKLYNEKTPILERLIFGNYLDEKEIHKRPMAKFTQDIAKQLGLL